MYGCPDAPVPEKNIPALSKPSPYLIPNKPSEIPVIPE